MGKLMKTMKLHWLQLVALLVALEFGSICRQMLPSFMIPRTGDILGFTHVDTMLRSLSLVHGRAQNDSKGAL